MTEFFFCHVGNKMTVIVIIIMMNVKIALKNLFLFRIRKLGICYISKLQIDMGYVNFGFSYNLVHLWTFTGESF